MVIAETTKQGTDWRSLLGKTIEEEHHYQPVIQGKIPQGLNGVLYRNGPGRFERGSKSKNNLLDGDGLIQTFRILDGKATYQNRFVRTEKFLEEEAAGTYLNETWTTLAPGGFLKNLGPPDIKSQAGIVPLYRNGKLYAFDEVDYPYALDGETLDTFGPEKIGSGALKNFKAHTKIDAQNGDWILFGTEFGKVMKAHVIIQGGNGSIKNQFSVDLPRSAYMHDFFVTENYVILNLQPASLNLFPMMIGTKSFTEALKWDSDKGNLLVLLNKNGSEKPIIIEAPTAWMWHSYNAYEVKDKIIADFIGYEEPDHFLGNDATFKTIMKGNLGTSNSKGRPRRYEIDLVRKTATETILVNQSCEFPIIHPTKASYTHSKGYASMGTNNNIFHSAITSLDFSSGVTDSFDFGDHIHVGEAVFAPDPAHPTDESRGWLMTIGLDGKTGKSFLAILDAGSLSDGPVATLQLSHHTPLSFHGCWRAI
ncbi:MAG: carotenoid oxygenase family protein [Sneathiella sp.]